MPLNDTLLEDEDSELVAPQRRTQRLDAPVARARPRTFELSDDAEMQLKELARSSRPMQSAPAEQAKAEKPLGLMGTIREGAKGTMRALGATADTMQGDAQGVVQAAQEQAAAPKDPDLERFYSHIEEQKKALGDNPSLWEGIKAVGSAAIDNPRGFGLMVAEQLPNSGVALGAAGAGALAGSFAGPLGAAVGGLAGLATANIGLETGAKALEAAADNAFTPEEQSRVRREGLVKGGVITSVDAATLGVTKFITNTSKRAVEHATTKALADRGVDITSATARKAAMQTPEIADAVKAAQKLAEDGANKLGKRLARTGGAVALETIGEGAGEYLGELAATGKANAVDAVIEGFAGLGTSIGEIAVTSALNRKGLNRLLDTQEEAEKTAETETKETGVEHEVIAHPTEPEKFVAVPKVRSISGIELTRDETGNLKPVAPVSTQADFNLANKQGFELSSEDKIRQRELERQREEALAKNPIIVTDKAPAIAGKPATELSNDALEYTLRRGGENARKIAAAELQRRKSQGIDPAIANAPEKPEDIVKRIVITGKEKAQEDRKARSILTPAPAPNVQPAAPMPAATSMSAANLQVVLPDNTSLPAQWDVVDADSVKASIKEGKNQPRDRSRAASDIQVQGIASNPDYRRLADSPVLDVGAPTLSAEGLIVGGNGRFEGVSRAYDQNTAGNYLANLKADAAAKGIDPAKIESMKKPVLVRRITQPFDVRKLAIASNSGTGLQYSGLELAKIDAERMQSLENLEITDSGDIALTSSNIPNIRNALSGYSAAELGALVDKDGVLSQEGVRRIKGALLYSAYGSNATLERLIESTDNDLRNISGALVRAAPSAARAKADIKAGRLPAELDISEQLVGAVETLSKIRAQGQSVDEYLSQSGLFGEEINEDTKAVLRVLEANIRSQKKIAEFVRTYYDSVSSIDTSTDDIFGAPQPKKPDLIKNAKERITEKQPESQDLFSRPAGGARAESAKQSPDNGRTSESRKEDQQVKKEGAEASDEKDEDWLTKLFGGGEAADNTRPDQVAPNHKLQKQDISAALATAKKNAQERLEKWSGKKYKENKNRITFEGDGPTRHESMSVGAINEGRKRKAIEAIQQEIRAIESIEKKLSTDAETTKFIALLEQTKRDAEKAAAQDDLTEKISAGDFFERMILDKLGIRPHRGSYTSTPLSKTLRNAIEAETKAKVEKTEKAKEKPAVAVRGNQKPVPRGGRILANGIAETIQKEGVAALVGQKITSPERLAELAQVYRNPQYETFRIFLTKGNEIVQASGVTARLPGSSPIFPKDMTFGQGSEWIKGMMQTAGADGYWMLHNHPSGDPTPSPEDVRTTQILAQLTPGFKGHVVINSNRYAQIMRRGEGGTKVITKRFGEDELLKASKPSEYIGKQIPSPKDVVPIGKSFQKEGWITLIGVSGVSGVRAIAEIPLKTFTTPMLARAAIRRFGRKSGAESVFAYGKESDLKAGNAAALTREGFLRSAVNEEGRSHGIGNPTKISFGRESGTGRMEVRQGKAKALQTDSLAFRRWFGKSKVVDKDGKPLVVYHGTASDFSKFGEDADVDFAQKLTGTDGEFYFTDDAALASDYAQEQNIGGENANVMPVYLSLSNPLIVDAKGLTGRDTFRFIRERIGDMAEGKNDGLIIHNVNDKIGDHNNPNATIYIARNRNQIKSAIGNRGTFDDSGFILNQNQAPFASKAPVRARMDKITDSLIYNFQDRFKPLKDIQKRAGPVAEDEDAALAEERYSGIVRARMDTFEEQMRDPLITAIHDSGVSYENAEEYLHALHAPSRNAAMREINPTEDELKTQISALEKQRDTLAKDKDVEKFVNLRRELRQAQADVEDGIADESLVRGLQSDIAQIRRQQNIKDYAEALDKLKALRLVKPFKGDNTALSGMSDKQAKDIIAKADKNGTRAKLDKVSAIVDSITARTRQIYVEGGLEKADAIDAWNQKYEHYVPLHRDEVGGNTMPKVGQGFNIRGKESKRATGSTKQVTDILAHVVAQHEAAIIRSEKARVDRALFQFASTHPDPSLWTLDDAPKLRTVDPVSGFVVERVDPTYKNRPEVLTLKIDGEEHTITFNTQNQEAMRLAASMKNLSSQELGEVTQLVGRVTRFLATMNTTMNPVFVARNFMRDMQTTFVNLSDTEIAAKKREVFRDIPAAIKGMWNLSRGKGNSQWAKYAQEFKAAGGQTGWMEHYKDIGTRAEALKKELAVMKPGKLNLARRTGKAWLNLIEDANNAVENGARLSAYVNARRSGLSEGKAAQLAKNLTVNFNARGAKSVELNAWYMFMNASIQGSARLIKAMGNRQVRKITAGIILSGFLMDIMARSMAGDDDEDGENDYDQLPEHTKAMNFVFMVGGQPVTVPMPYGYNFFASAGRKVSEMMFRENYSPVRSAADLAAVFLDAFSPTGQAGSALQFAAPTVADPFVQWAENKNFAGNPLRKDQNNFGPPKPEFQMGFKSTSAPAKWLAEALNDTTGGNEVRPGFVNVNPVFFDFAVSSILGGAGRTYLQIASGPLKAVGDDEIQAREIPFANIFVGARPEYQTERKYFDAVGEVELADKELRTYMQKGDTEMVREIREEHGNLLRLRESAKITKELLARLRKRDLALDKQDPPNKAQLRREIEEKKREAMSRFNKKYREAVTAEG